MRSEQTIAIKGCVFVPALENEGWGSGCCKNDDMDEGCC
jgi:hypothetical protein